MSGGAEAGKDFLWLHLRELPYFRSLLRAVEARFYRDIALPAPTLDVGCGDGHFAAVAFDRPLEVGIDPWTGPVREAARRAAYRDVVQGAGAGLPFPGSRFGSAVSNSVLEHIPEVEAVLSEVARVLRPGAPFVFCVPNHRFPRELSIAGALDRLRFEPLADGYRRLFNRISRHEHCDPPEVWADRLDRAGLRLERWWHYFSPAALHALEWGHYFGLPSLFARRLTGRWILVPARWNLALTDRLVRPFYRERAREDGVYTFFIARREG